MTWLVVVSLPALLISSVVATSLPELLGAAALDAPAPVAGETAAEAVAVDTPQSEAVSSLALELTHGAAVGAAPAPMAAHSAAAAATKAASDADGEYKTEYKQEAYSKEYPTTTYTTTTPYTTTTRCYPYYVPYQVDKCIPWTEQVCHTTQKETCADVPDKYCRSLITSKQVRKCVPVTEKVCRLHEEVKYETINEPYSIPKCVMVPEKVCDTVYETATTTKERQVCQNVEKPYCKDSYYTVYDKTCRTSTEFDCDYEYGDAEKGSGSYNSSYEPSCKRRQDTKCYQTPRTVTTQKCYHKYEKACEKLVETAPYPKKKLNCHTEEKRICSMEQHYQPKQVKKYVYVKKCVPVPSQVCANSDTKQLVPKCVPTTRKYCKYTPVTKCQKTPKKYCYKITKRQRKEKCERGGTSVEAPAYKQEEAPAHEEAQQAY